MKLKIFTGVTYFLLGLVSALTIEQDTYFHNPFQSPFAEFEISSNVLASLSDIPALFVTKKFFNEGNFFYTNSPKVSAVMSIGGILFQNDREFVFTAHNPNKNQFIGYTKEFENFGSMFVGISGPPTESKVVLSSESIWENYGLLFVASFQQLNFPVTLGRHNEDGLFGIVNYKTICLHNAAWETLATIQGSGCIIVGHNSYIHLHILEHLQAPEQIIRMGTYESRLLISGFSLPVVPKFEIVGFQGNIFLQDVQESDVQYVHYDLSEGVLTVQGHSTTLAYFHIGQNYDQREIRYNVYEEGIVLTYGLPIPAQIVPLNCNCPNSFPVPPVEPSSSSTSSTLSSESFASTSASVAPTDLPLSSTSATPSALSSISSTDTIMSSSSGSSDYPESSISSKASSMSSNSQTSPALSSVPHLSSVSSTDSHVSSESSTNSATSSESFSHSAASLAMTSASSLSSAKPVSSGASDSSDVSSMSPASSTYPLSSGASKPSSLSSSPVHYSSSASLGPKYTTTYTTTETDHSIVTKTIVVCVTTDATGGVTTVTTTVLHCPTTDCEPTELPNPTITGETPVPTASCDEGGSCTPAVKTTSNIAPVPSRAAKVTYTTETLTITTTISNGPGSYATSTSTLTVIRTVSIDCDTCETGEGPNPTVAPATDAPGHVLGSTTSSSTMTATPMSSISPFEGGAGSRSVVLGMLVLSLLAFLL